MPFLVIELWHEKRGGQLASFEQVRVGDSVPETLEILEASHADLSAGKFEAVEEWIKGINSGGNGGYGDVLRIEPKPPHGGVVMVIPTQYAPDMFKIGKMTVTRMVEQDFEEVAVVHDETANTEERGVRVRQPVRKKKPAARKTARKKKASS